MISKIYFSIVSFFIFIFSVLSIVFIILQNGLFINEINISNLHIKQLYIKWNEKIDFSIEEIKIVKNNSSKKSIDYEELEKNLNKVFLGPNIFQSITIENIQYNDISASFKYRNNENGFLVASSDEFQMMAEIFFDGKYLNLAIKEFKDEKKKIFLSGDIYIDLNAHQLASKLLLNINQELNTHIYLYTTQERLSYKIDSLQNIKSLTHIINLAQLPKKVRYWALDAIDMKDLQINTAYGYIDFNNTKEILKNIYISATVNKLNYTYNPKLDAIHTAKTELEFKKGVLYIRPKKAYSYGQNLQESWLKIDFTKKEELLTLQLLFDGTVDKSMLKILDTYKITLPFLQNSGSVATDLIIKVGLRNINIDAQGKFFVKKGNFTYLGLNIDVKDVNVILDNYDVKVSNMHAKYKDIAKADVDIDYNAKNAKGTIVFRVQEVHTQGVDLNTKNAPLVATYHIQQGLDNIIVDKSIWKISTNKTITIDPINIPFDLDELSLRIPTTYVKIEGIASAYIAGKVDLKNMIIDLNTDLLSFQYAKIKLDQSNTQLKIHYDKKISISAKDEILFDFDGTFLKTSNVFIEIDGAVVDIKHTKINIGNYLKASISAKYDKKKKIELVRVKNLKITNNGSLLYKRSRLVLRINNTDNHLIISSKEIDAKLDISEKQWQLKLDSLKNISRGSQQLKRLSLTEGTLFLRKKANETVTNFSANIIYPYKILLKNGNYINNYIVEGKIDKEKVNLTINDNMSVAIDEDIKIKIKSLGINIDEVIKLVKNINSQTNSKSSKNLSLNASNSYLELGNERKAISDTISLQYFNNILTAQLKHKKGVAGFKLDKNKFHLYGKDFNDAFMEKLFTLSKFKEGTLNFSMSGTLDDYDGVFYIRNTTVTDYVIMNNILAFINTIPSLTTFSIPGYNRRGLFIEEAYMQFKSLHGQFDISDLYLESKEIRIAGSGEANINNDTIDIDLVLKTDLGSSTAKIPVVGYIVLGKDNISTGVKVSGKLSNPKVKSLIIKDIIKAPINIIKRTLLLPYNWLNFGDDKNASK
jgi:hypothetical protein